MSTRETVEAFTSAMERGDWDTAAEYLADDFQVTTDTRPDPMRAAEWLAMSRALREGIPDLSYNFHIESVEGDAAQVSTRLTGTHTADLDLSGMGMGVIPATGRSFEAGREYSEGEVGDDGRIRRIHVYAAPDSGIASVLAQLGAAAPG